MSQRYARVALWALSLGYLGLELSYVERLPLVMDEFQGGEAVYRLRSQVPYRDFNPYKTTLGYYLQLPFMLLSDDVFSRLLSVKRALAVVNAAMILGVGHCMLRLFRPRWVLLATALLCSMSTFLERSAALRVDMLTAWAGLWSLIFLLRGRVLGAGLWAGLSFLLSQKGAYYVVAVAAGQVAVWASSRGREDFRDCVRLGLGAGLPVLAYVVAFSLASGAGTVVGATFEAPRAIAVEDLYPDMGRYWLQTLSRNPLFYGLSALCFAALWPRRHLDQRRPLRLLAYGVTLLCLCLWHKQPWPYFFVLLVPTLFVGLASGLPLGLGAWSGRAFLLLVLAFGVAMPLASRVPVVWARSSAYQAYSVRLAERLLEPQEAYLAAVAMVHTREQVPRALAWIDRRRRERLKHADLDALIASIDAEPPKLLLWNYRFRRIPMRLRRYFEQGYCRLSGAVRGYCPRVRGTSFELAYAGPYRLLSRRPVWIDGERVEPGELRSCSAGPHRVGSPARFQLAWSPSSLGPMIEQRYHAEQALFPSIYRY